MKKLLPLLLSFSLGSVGQAQDFAHKTVDEAKGKGDIYTWGEGARQNSVFLAFTDGKLSYYEAEIIDGEKTVYAFGFDLYRRYDDGDNTIMKPFSGYAKTPICSQIIPLRPYDVEVNYTLDGLKELRETQENKNCRMGYEELWETVKDPLKKALGFHLRK